MIHICNWGEHEIKYDISYSNRKTIGIMVMPNKDVHVKAPEGSELTRIKERVRKRAGWILKQWRYFDSFGEPSPPKMYLSGESHSYLGRQYMLKVIDGDGNTVKYKGRYFEVICSDRANVAKLMKEWYKERAKVKFAEIAEPIISRFSKYGIEPTSLYIQDMSNRWGSCTAKGKIILNTELIKAPKPCIEYVITHELCHLIHHDHTKAFFELLEVEMPNWKRWKDKLERYMI